MQFYEVLLTGVALAADAFAASVCIGLATDSKRNAILRAAEAGLYFGAFQALMPLIGYLAASLFSERFATIGGYAAAFVLVLIGAKMLWQKQDDTPPPLVFSRMLALAVATSIDALAVGAGLAFLGVNIASVAATIGIVTLVIAAAGVFVGAAVGNILKNKAEKIGGIILIVIGIKILLESIQPF